MTAESSFDPPRVATFVREKNACLLTLPTYSVRHQHFVTGANCGQRPVRAPREPDFVRHSQEDTATPEIRRTSTHAHGR